MESPRGKYEFSKYDKLKKKLEEWTGKNITTPWDYYYIYHTLVAEQSYGLTLPSWTNNIFPRGELLDATVFTYNITNSTPLLKKLYGGNLIIIFLLIYFKSFSLLLIFLSSIVNFFFFYYYDINFTTNVIFSLLLYQFHGFVDFAQVSVFFNLISLFLFFF